MANRDRHRQGLVYGPVRPSGPRDRGRIVGNLLGFLVVVVTVSLLGMAIYLLVQARGVEPVPPAATPTAQAAAQATETAQASPGSTALATSAASAAPSPTLSSTPGATIPVVTPAPTLFVPPVVSGPGFVTFGTSVDAQLHVIDPKTTFAIDEPMVWSAYLTQPANSTDLIIRILIQDPNQPSGQRVVREDAVQPDVQGAQIYFRRLKPIGETEGAGLFMIEYVRADEVLSTGSFLVR